MAIAFQVSLAESSLKEERARADDREALLRETILTEREKEDRLVFPVSLYHILVLLPLEGPTRVSGALPGMLEGCLPVALVRRISPS